MPAYPAQTRYIRRACEKAGYRFTDLNDGAGYLFAVSDGVYEIVSGSGAICSWPINSAHAFCISRDKHHTNAVLARAGIPVIESHLFFLNDRHAKHRAPGRERADAAALFARMQKPVFCKPNSGSHGDYAEIVSDDAAFRDYLARVSERYETVLLQPVIEGDEYRVFCLDGETLFATRKAEFALVGDGRSTLAELLAAHNRSLAGEGVSALGEGTMLAAARLRHGIGGEYVPAAGEKLILPGRRNLSAGGDVADLTTDVPAPLKSLAQAATKAVGLRVAGIDIFDRSGDLGDLVVIEVNGNPGIQALELAGRNDLIDTIWTRVLARCFDEARS